MQFNVICGLPRSGSTLLCNLLNQNPRFYASSTSPVGGLIAQANALLSTSIEVKGALGRDRERAEEQVRRTLNGSIRGWYHHHKRKVVFDKCRGWGNQILLLRALHPNSKVIVTVRDVRDVFASFEKQHRKTALFAHGTPNLMENRLRVQFASPCNEMPQGGMIGGPLAHIRDMLQRGLDVHFFVFEQFCRQPQIEMGRLYCYLMEKPMEHDFENVENVSEEPDHLYHFKFPHNGSGKVEPPSPCWPEFMSIETANRITDDYGWFFNRFYPAPRLTDVPAIQRS